MKRLNISLLLLLALGTTLFTGCKDDNDTSLTAVTNVTYEPTMGGAIIKFTPPVSNDLLYVKATYTNSLGDRVYRSASIYDNKIEIEGLADETRDYPVEVTAVDKWGGESSITTINVRPNRSYINVIADNLKVTPICGGLAFSWENPAGSESGANRNNGGKYVYVVVDYVDSANVSRTRYLGNNQRIAVSNVRGLIQGDYQVSYHVEDFTGNKTAQTTPVTITVPPEVLFPKYILRNDEVNGEWKDFIWKLDSKLTTLVEAYEYKNDAIFDGIIDNKDDANSHSYCGTNSSGNIEWDSEAVDIVIDMNQVVSISRIVAWQRAYHYGSQPYSGREEEMTSGVSDDYDYYQPTNIKRFKVFGSMDKENWELIQDCDIATNSTAGALPEWGANPDWFGHAVSNMPTNASYQAALDGHEWLLDQMTDSVRYIRVRLVENWDMSKRQVSGISELNLYGATLVDYKTLAEKEAAAATTRRRK